MSKKNGNVSDAEFVDNFDESEFNTERNADALIWGPDDDGPLFFVPRTARMVDSSIKGSENKISILVLGELLKGRELTDANEEKVNAPPGTLVGVWVSGGIHKLINFGNCKVKLQPTGEMQKLPGRNAMRKFSIVTPRDIRPSLVTLDGDFRKESRNTPSPWDIKRPGSTLANLSDEQRNDTIPF